MVTVLTMPLASSKIPVRDEETSVKHAPAFLKHPPSKEMPLAKVEVAVEDELMPPAKTAKFEKVEEADDTNPPLKSMSEVVAELVTKVG